MISFHVLLFFIHLASANTLWRITVSCPDNTTSDLPDFNCNDLLPLCYKQSKYHGHKPLIKSDYSLECFVKNASEIRLSVYKLHVELSKNSLSVLSGPVVVKLSPLLPADILAVISKLEVPVLISVRRNDIAQNLTSSNNIVSIGVEQVFSKLTTLLDGGVRLPCALFDRPANFTICINAEENKGVFVKHELSTCTVLSVHQWKEYAIQMRTDRLFPCEGIGISVSTRTPNCSSDVVLHQLRLLAIQDRLYSPIETKRRGVYVGEQRLQPGVSVVNFHCNYFDLIYPEYCFQMVSVLGDGFVQQHAQRCVSTELKTRVPIHGRWSAWKGWGSCSTGCNAVQHRFRFCDNPPPRFGGRFCEGVGMETARCNSSCHDVKGKKQPVEDSGICKCGGCTLTVAGAIVMFSGMCANYSYWNIVSPDNGTFIRWWMPSTCLAMSNERLKIRDGIGPSSPVLFDSNGQVFSDVVIITSKPSSTLELQVVPGTNGFERNNEIIAKEDENGLLNVCVFHYSFVRADRLKNYLTGEKWIHLGITAAVSGVALIGLSLIILLCMRQKIEKLCCSLAGTKKKKSLMDVSICKVALLQSTHCGGENVHNSDSVPADMMNSTRTQVTQVSIDDTKDNEDALINSNRVAISSIKRTDSASQASFIENEQEFEYDYYDAPVIGSILNPLQPWELIDSEFDLSTE